MNFLFSFGVSCGDLYCGCFGCFFGGDIYLCGGDEWVSGFGRVVVVVCVWYFCLLCLCWSVVGVFCGCCCCCFRFCCCCLVWGYFLMVGLMLVGWIGCVGLWWWMWKGFGCGVLIFLNLMFWLSICWCVIVCLFVIVICFCCCVVIVLWLFCMCIIGLSIWSLWYLCCLLFKELMRCFWLLVMMDFLRIWMLLWSLLGFVRFVCLFFYFLYFRNFLFWIVLDGFLNRLLLISRDYFG